ncbi:GAF and ANTAR domain-containing protein [Streptomyces xanthochromogenes]|uniref:Transcriptional regulator n=1 Tax=Streptomyces xanthochromogenes TaxID=67384 RepID=A0ABQ3AXF3_9ACTN|nr:GAF and ANTAR domain-containing protein [Streptomyces xanthochromogenes]GGY66894.1 transcriptional regulator [Streptomyces xanthochromogenes]
MGREQRLAEVFVELADSLIDDFDVIEFLQGLSARCVELLGISAAGIMLGDEHGELHTIAASDENTHLLELFAIQHDQGPCVDTFRSGGQRTNIDLTDPKATAAFPHFARQARKNGFAVTHALPLRLRTRMVGAMNLFHTESGSLTPENIALAQALADIATIAVLQQRTLEQTYVERDQLQAALTSRIVIEQAKGILAERWNTSLDDAFDRFRSYARNNGLRMSDLARQIIDKGTQHSALS